MEGPSSRYYDNGVKEGQGNHKNGKRHGDWVFYDRNGKIEKEFSGIYEHGVKVSNIIR